MIESEIFAQQLTAARTKLSEIAKALDIEHLKEQLVEYQEDMASNGFWDDMERATARLRPGPPGGSQAATIIKAS